jgi:dipeptide/tripeptide permease
MWPLSHLAALCLPVRMFRSWDSVQGMALLASTALIPGLGPHHGASVQPFHFVLLYAALYIVALGTGGIKPNVSAFGADQFDDTNPEEIHEKKSFFNWFYFSVNLGGIIAMTVIVWIQVRASST